MLKLFNKVPFDKIRNELLLFGILFLVGAFIIFNNTNWPSEYQFTAFILIFIIIVVSYVFLKARDYVPTSPQSHKKEEFLPPSIPFTNDIRLDSLKQLELVKQFGDGELQDYSQVEQNYQSISEITILLAEICGVKWREPSENLEWKGKNNEAGDLLCELIRACHKFQIDSGRWDDATQWSAWGYILKKSQADWFDAAGFACEIITIEFLRDGIDVMKQWTAYLDKVVQRITESSLKNEVQAKYYRAKGLWQFRDGYIDQAAEHLLKANEALKNSKEENGRIQILNELGTLEIRRLKFVDAKHYFDEAMSISKKNNWGSRQLECNYNLWLLYKSQRKKDEEFQKLMQDSFVSMVEQHGALKRDQQTALMNSRVFYEIATQQYQNDDYKNAYLNARQALSLETTLQTPDLPRVRELLIEITDKIFGYA